jgi:hypothetical protein
MKNKILCLFFAFSVALQAGDDFSTARAKSNEIRTAKGSTADVLVRGGVVGGGRAKGLRRDLRTVGVSNPDNLNRRAVARSPKHMEQQLPTVQEIQVAPVK